MHSYLVGSKNPASLREQQQPTQLRPKSGDVGLFEEIGTGHSATQGTRTRRQNNDSLSFTGPDEQAEPDKLSREAQQANSQNERGRQLPHGTAGRLARIK